MKKLVISFSLLVSFTAVFIITDKICYLSKGISVFNYNTLPCNTKIQGDHNTTGWYSFEKNNTKEVGYTLEPQLIFKDIIEVPTHAYYNDNDSTLFVWQINEYGFNNDNIVIKVWSKRDNAETWLMPVKRNGKYVNIIIDEADIDKDKYEWINIRGWGSYIAIRLWILSIIAIPILLLVILVKMFPD